MRENFPKYSNVIILRDLAPADLFCKAALTSGFIISLFLECILKKIYFIIEFDL